MRACVQGLGGQLGLEFGFAALENTHNWLFGAFPLLRRRELYVGLAVCLCVCLYVAAATSLYYVGVVCLCVSRCGVRPAGFGGVWRRLFCSISGVSVWCGVRRRVVWCTSKHCLHVCAPHRHCAGRATAMAAAAAAVSAGERAFQAAAVLQAEQYASQVHTAIVKRPSTRTDRPPHLTSQHTSCVKRNPCLPSLERQ